MLYTSASPELAALEAVAHWQPGAPAHWLCRVELPARASVRRVGALPANWRRRKALTRAIGNRWFDAARSAALVVPSALCPEADNVLVNPLHADCDKLRLVVVRRFHFDRRLLRITPP